MKNPFKQLRRAVMDPDSSLWGFVLVTIFLGIISCLAVSMTIGALILAHVVQTFIPITF